MQKKKWCLVFSEWEHNTDLDMVLFLKKTLIKDYLLPISGYLNISDCVLICGYVLIYTYNIDKLSTDIKKYIMADMFHSFFS